jgi:hypothetical protein
VDPGQIVDLVGSHINYVVELLNIHDVNVPDLSHVGDILDHVSQVIDWVDDLGQGDGDLPPADPALIPLPVQHHLDLVWNHVGYVRDLIALHDDAPSGDHDWVDLITAHFGYVQDILGMHGVVNGQVQSVIDHVLDIVFSFWPA